MRLGNLITRLLLDNSQLEKGARQSESTLGRLGSRATSLTKSMTLVTGAVKALGGSMLAVLTKQGMSAVDAQAKLARSLDATADGVRAVQIATSDAGIDGMEASLNRLNRRLGAVSEGGGPAAATIEALNLNLEDLRGMDADERLAAIADAIKDNGMASDEAAHHLRQLGFEQANANDFFRQGGDAIRAARQEVDDYGLSLSAVDAAQVESANDAFSRIGRTVEVLRQRLAVQLAPFIEYVADLINDATKETGGFREEMDTAISGTIRKGAMLADVFAGIRRTTLLLGKGAAVVALQFERNMLHIQTAIMEGPFNAVNNLIRALNRIPGIDVSEIIPVSVVRNSRARVEMLERAVAEGRQDIKDMLLEPMPSTGVEERLDEIRRRSREAAESVIADRERMAAPVRTSEMQEAMNAMLSSVRESYDAQVRVADRALEAMQISEADHARKIEAARAQMLGRLSDMYMPTVDAAQSAYDQIVSVADDALARQLISEQQHADKVAAAREELARRVSDIEAGGIIDQDQVRMAGQAAVEAVRRAYDEQMRIASDALARQLITEEQYAEDVVASREAMQRRLAALVDDVEIPAPDTTAAEEAYREHLRRRLQSLRESLMAEEQLQQHRHEQQLDELDEFLNEGLIDREEHARKVEALTEHHGERMAEIAARQSGEMTEAERAGMERRLDSLRESLMEEQELLEKRHQDRLEELRGYLDADLMEREEYQRMVEDLEEQHQKRLSDIIKRANGDNTDEMGMFHKMNVAMRQNAIREEASHLRAGLQTMFGDSKMASRAMAGLKRLEAISSAYAWGSSRGGPPAGVAAASLAAAAQMRTLRAIESQSFTGGASGVTGVPSGASTAMAEPQEVQRSVSIDLALVGGNDRDRAVAGSIIEQINSEVRRGARIDRLALST